MAMNPRLLRPTASGFNPKSISGLIGWWDANDLSTLTLNTTDPANPTVSEWRDKSGSNFHVAQSTAANQPAYVTGSLNGKPGLDWGATALTGKKLQRGSMPAYAPREKYIIADYDDANPFPGFVGMFHDREPISGASGGTNSQVGSGSFEVHSFNGAANSFTMLPVMLSPFSLRARLNTTSLPTTTTNDIAIGGWSSVSTRGWAGKIYEVLMFSRALSNAEDARVRGYIKAKWGINT